MITHNGTYLGAATHHGMPIVAATMGGKMVIGDWLLSATLQAIVAAFGSAEGTEVIRKTNDYLNRIAQTDPARALLLAGFLNEDHMLVCSLVETSKTRWLVAGGEPSDIVTDISFSQFNEIEWEWMQTSNSSSLMQFGSRLAASGSAGIIVSLGKAISNIIRIYNGSWNTIMSNTQDFVQYGMKLNLSENKIYIDGVAYSHTFTTANKEAATFKILDGCYASISHIIADGEIIVAPFIRNNIAGWINLNDGSFYSASKGTFTIAITDTTPALAHQENQ
jgi:hypothetical protein